MRQRLLALVSPAVLAVLFACSPGGEAPSARTPADSARVDSIARARQDSINRTLPGYVVDSTLPVEEELRRFRAALGGDSVSAFKGGSASREELVRRFVRALAAGDTAALQAMVVHAREFADLYYPESPWTHPPYRQSPALAWMLIEHPSSLGLTRLLRRRGGKPLQYVSLACEPKVVHEGRNTRYTGCLVHVIEERGDTVTRRYFGSIIARDGQFKFLSYTNP